MTELTSGSVSMQTLYDNIDTYKTSPVKIVDTMVDYIDELLDGAVDIVDPTNPFILLLEMSAVSTSVAVNTNIVNLRAAYAKMAQTQEELYHHMTDSDYLGRFATPGTAPVTIMLEVNELINKLVYDESEGAYKGIIPRDSYVTVDGYVLTNEYPIVIRRYDNGVVQISYDSTYTSPITTLSQLIIPYTVRISSTDKVQYVNFTVDMKQMTLTSSQTTISASTIFSVDYSYTNYFVYARAFYQNSATGTEWVEVATTHSDQVFDSGTPTVVLTVSDPAEGSTTGTLNVSIPYIYVSNGSISGVLRVDIYTTLGEITEDLSTYTVDSFKLSIRAIDSTRDLNVYTNQWANLSLNAYSSGEITGGTAAIDFDTLRDQVINHVAGPRQIPITNVEAASEISKAGFTLVPNVDALTNRIFLATQSLPTPTNADINTPANMGMISYTADLDALKNYTNVKINDRRATFLSYNLFSMDNGVATLIDQSDIDDIEALNRTTLISTVNATSYVYNPFYYVLDVSEDVPEIRAYDLDNPTISDLSIIRQNQTLQMPVNTDEYTITKESTGFKIVVTTSSGNNYQQVADSMVFAQLGISGYLPNTDTATTGYVLGTMTGTTDDDERIFEFVLETNYDVNGDDQIYISTLSVDEDTVGLYVPISFTMNLFHATTSLTTAYIADETDALLGKFQLPTGVAGNTQETFTVTIGQALSNLWTRCRPAVAGATYQTYTKNIPKVYAQDYYSTDTDTGSILDMSTGVPTYTKLYSKGDYVYDDEGNQEYEHLEGDTVLDSSGNPLEVDAIRSSYNLDLLVVDGKMYFVTDTDYLAYREEISATITDWVVNDLEDLEERLLEKTQIYYYPLSAIGTTKIMTSASTTASIDSEQSLTVTLYVESAVLASQTIQDQMRATLVATINTVFSESSFTMTYLHNAIIDALGTSVSGVVVSGIGGSTNYQSITVATGYNKLCLAKKLATQTDGTLYVTEDLTLTFTQY